MIHSMVQVSLPGVTALPRDTIVNTFHFRDPDPASSVASSSDVEQHFGQVATLLSAFYDALDGILCPSMFTSPASLKGYLMQDPLPRLPQWQASQNIDATSVPALPREVTAVISWQAAVESGQNPRRARGRTYVGPLGTPTVETASGRSRLTTAARTALGNAGAAMIPGSAHAQLCVFSRLDAQGVPIGGQAADEFEYTHAQLETGYKVVTGGWVDDAFDTQRRRGTDATLRATFS